jgi:mannitol-1-phosphate 5-dehydrogenase
MKALHFGAGNLGRGLVVPVLVDSGVEVAVADADQALIDALAQEEGYRLEIISETRQIGTRRIPLVGAFHVVEDRAALETWLQDATFITTSVQFENLPKVAASLDLVVKRKMVSNCPFYVLACENVERSSSHLARLMGLDLQAAREVFLDTVVDRNSQTDWPRSLVARTEAYWEWAVELSEDSQFPLETLRQVRHIMPPFWRKRYLVNTVADSLAFLGFIRGHHYLHEAFQDAVLLDLLAPLFSELQHALVHQFEFNEGDLQAYTDKVIRRLGTPGIDRQILTVARGAWRKLELGERFVHPVETLLAHGERPLGLARAMAAVIWVAKGLDRQSTLEPDAVLSEVNDLWRGVAWSDEMQSLVFDQLNYLTENIERLTP